MEAVNIKKPDWSKEPEKIDFKLINKPLEEVYNSIISRLDKEIRGPKNFYFIFVFAFLVFATVLPSIVFAADLKFNIDPEYDISAREEVNATLVKTFPKLYFYIEKNWWDSQNQFSQNKILTNLDLLSQEFENKIYTNLTSIFGSEWKPGIDGDERIILLFHQMR